MATLSIDFRELREFNRRFQGLPRSLRAQVQNELMALSFTLVREARERAPVRTGFLRDSIFSIVAQESRGFRIELGARAYYSPYQEFGTRYIEPKRFLRGAIEEVKPELVERIKRACLKASEVTL